MSKTEIARRLAKLARALYKNKATGFTEVGYVGRDVDSIVRDLVDVAINMLREEQLQDVAQQAEDRAEERVLDALLPAPRDSGDDVKSQYPTNVSKTARGRTGRQRDRH